jgi:hypothetical protein
MQITNRTVSFKEGSNSISDHYIFEDESGTEYIPDPYATQTKWLLLSDIKKERHDRVAFLQDAARQTGVQTKQSVMAAAYAHTSNQQRVVSPKPLKVITVEGKLVDNQ